jgi:cholesterol oxidase
MTARLSTSDGLATRYDCVVVGSGFGASVFAYRLAAALGPGRVAVLERGPELRPGEFPTTLAAAAAQIRTPATPSGIFDLRPGRDLDALVANVLGGGSQLYAAVTLEPLPQTFGIRRDPADAASPRAWPETVTAAALAPYYDRVRDMLEVEPWADRDLPGGGPRWDHAGRDVRHRPPIRRAALFDRAVAGVGGRVRPAPLAINLTRHHGAPNRFGAVRAACTGCGNCVTGCNVGAKNSLTANYLPAAVAAGAEIHTGAEVAYLRPSEVDGYRWALPTRVRPPDGIGGPERTVVVHARVVVLGAGVFGTTGMLFAARRHGLPVPPLLGTRVSGNGDAIVAARMVSAAPSHALPPDLLDEPGPTITRMLDRRAEPGRRHLVQDSAVPQALSALRLVADERALVMLTMGYDTAQGRLVERGGRLEIRWPAAGHDPVQRSARTTVAAMAAALGSRLIVNPRLGGVHSGAPVTVHPLGGAPMGTGPGDGVVDDRGRLFHPAGGVVDGVYVADASVIPTSVGANPSLTIAALAERAADALVAGDLERLAGPWC